MAPDMILAKSPYVRYYCRCMKRTFAPTHRHGSNGNIIAIVVIVFLLLILANMFAYWLFRQNRNAQVTVRGERVSRIAQKSLPELAKETSQDNVTPESVLRAVRELVSLDELEGDVKPVVAEIVNKDGLAAEDPIFEEAINGDYVILNGTQLVFYRPNEKRIVLFQRIEPDRFSPKPTETVASSTVALPLPAAIELRTAALSQKQVNNIGDRLRELDWVVSLDITSSLRNDYLQTYIVDQTNGSNPNALAELQARFGGETVAKVPEQERPSGADFLIFFGP